MILLDDPYVSEFLKTTIRENNLPLIGTEKLSNFGFENAALIIEEKQAIAEANKSEYPTLFTPTENALDWIITNLKDTKLPEKIELFKNKAQLRDLLRPLFPSLFYKKIKQEELDTLDTDKLPLPFIIKPNQGFASMGVHKVSDPDQWSNVLTSIKAEIQTTEELYPKVVLDNSSYIIEECIEGTEFAIDSYFDDNGEVVILNILEHDFSDDEDMSDRVYRSSKAIIEEYLEAFTAFLNEVGKVAGIRNFPIHVEVRQDESGKIVPIEFNPMRFGGWCSSADLTHMAFGSNSYLHYFNKTKPDWESLLKHKADLTYSVIVLTNTTGIDGKDIESFDYELLKSHFSNPLELRPNDFKKHPHFGFFYVESKNNKLEEIQKILKSDLTEYIKSY